MQNSCIPAIKHIIHTSDGHPETGSPKISFLIIITKIIMNANAQNNNPANEESISGTVENATIPSIA